MLNLHPTQKLLLKLLRNSQIEGYSMRQMQALIGVSSPGIIAHHLKQLEKKGLLRRNPNNPQDYYVIEEKAEEPIVYLNVYSTAQCGPNGLIASTEPIDKVPVASRLLGFPADLAFVVKARGHSMKPRINEGDYIISKKVTDKYAYQNYNNKMVICINDGDCLVKIVHYDNKTHHVLLESLNSNYPPFIANENFWIEGEVKSIFSYSK